jgi:radical SAM protein with 4Fe4S-binding SPASM domain
MPLVLNPNYKITIQDTTILLHTTRLTGTGKFWSISSAEAMVLSLYDGTRDTNEIRKTLSKDPRFSPEDIENFIKITRYYIDQSVLIDVNLLKDHSKIKVYNPLDFPINPQIKQKGERLDSPLVFTYLPTLNCNRACRYCYANSPKDKSERHISFDRLIKIIDEASSIGINSINISGGEPFLRPDLIRIIEYILNKGIYPVISTKAFLPENTVQRLCRAGLEDIQISLDSPDPHTANFLVGHGNYHKEVLDTIQLFIKYGIKVHLNCVCTSYNIKQVPSLFGLASNMNISSISLSPYVISLGRHEEDLFPSIEDKQWLISMIPNLAKEYPNIKLNDAISNVSHDHAVEEDGLPKGLYCTVGILGFILLPNGEVSICERLARDHTCIVGDLNIQSIMEMWHSKKWDYFHFPDQKFYSKTECSTCKAFGRCTELRRRCYVRTKLTYNRLYGPEPSCPKVQNRMVLSPVPLEAVSNK